MASIGRRAAAADRESAAADREESSLRRGSSVQDRSTAQADRATALADRVAAAGSRASSSLDRDTALVDRDTALDDREASADDRWRAAAYVSFELQLAESEARVKHLFHALPDPVIVTDGDGLIELVNFQALALFGYSAEELIGHPVELLIPEGQREAHRAHRAAFVATADPRPMSTGPNVVAVCKDGSRIPVEVHLSAISLSSGPAVLATLRDISDRKLAQAERRINEERFRASFVMAPIGMALIDLDPERAGQFLRVNEAMCVLTGYDETDLMDISVPEIIHPEDRARARLALDRMVQGVAKEWTTDDRYRTASGADIWGQGVVCVVHDAEDRPSYGVFQLEDITERRGAELKMAEALAKEKDAVLRLSELNVAKNQFVDDVSHELRTPLASLAGYSELLQDEALNEFQDQCVDAIVRNAARLSALTEDLLLVSGFSSPEHTRTSTEVDLKTLLVRVQEVVSTLATRRTLTLEFELPQHQVIVTGDVAALERVALNLISNAIKFSDPGATVTCRLSTSMAQAVLEVHDTGLGIPRDEQKDVFTAFFRGSATRDHAIQGTGLGLHIVHTIVADHGGAVSVRSAPMSGSTFTVRLPLSVLTTPRAS